MAYSNEQMGKHKKKEYLQIQQAIVLALLPGIYLSGLWSHLSPPPAWLELGDEQMLTDLFSSSPESLS